MDYAVRCRQEKREVYVYVLGAKRKDEGLHSIDSETQRLR